MTYSTHILTGLLAGGTILLQHSDPQFALLSATLVGSILPDIDEPNSYAGRSNRGTSHLIKALFGHRGITHSLLGLAFISAIIYAVIYYYQLDIQYLIFFNIGYLSHIMTDLLTKSGVPLLFPYKKNLKIPIIRTGDKKEVVFRTLIFIGIAFQIGNYLKYEIEKFL